MGKRITVAYLVRPAEGGIKAHLLTLLSGLDRKRFEPVIICPPGTSLYQEAESLGYTMIPLDLIGDLNPIKDLKAILSLRRILRRVRPNVLHIHSAKAGLVGRLATVLMKRPKIVLTLHSFVFDERVGARKRALVAWLERKLSRRTDLIIAVSNALRDELIAAMGLPANKIVVIPNGVVFQDACKSENEGLRIGTVARLAPQKGVDHFIRAAALVNKKFSSAEFVVIGDGPLRESLETLADDLGIIDSVRFMGHQSNALSIVSGFDVFVLASTWETFGLTLVEALSQEVPVVASRVGGIPEIVDGVTTGLLAEPGNAEELAANICRLLEDKDLAASIGRNGCRFVRSSFSSERMIATTQVAYLDTVLGVSYAQEKAGQT